MREPFWGTTLRKINRGVLPMQPRMSCDNLFTTPAPFPMWADETNHDFHAFLPTRRPAK
jgi:hypothetical protein